MGALPLVGVQGAKPQGEPQVGDLVTVRLFNGVVAGARLHRVAYKSYFVRIAGLVAPKPYLIGDNLVLSREQIIDWGA